MKIDEWSHQDPDPAPLKAPNLDKHQIAILKFSNPNLTDSRNYLVTFAIMQSFTYLYAAKH